MTKQINFTFNHEALIAGDNITVVKFNGDEGISKLFEFAIELKSTNADLDIDAILESPASLEISLGDDVRKIQGIVSHFDAVRQINHETIYVATLVPRLWELSLYHTNEVYLEQTVSEIIETVLQEAGFTSLDYDISGIEENDVTGKVWPYKCQYGETHLDFISRLMERDGIYYYFVEGDVGEKIVFCNGLNFQEAIAVPDVLYSPMSSLEINSLENTVSSFVSQQKRLPHKVLVKDYNDDKPSVDIKGEAIIDEKANKSSEIYVWGQNIETPEEGGVLAQIRAEEFLATKRTYHGESSVVRLLTGFNFTLKDHFRQTCNQEYLLVSISHEGSNPSALDFSGGIGELPPVYGNSFSAIAADVQYRPEIVTNKPEIHGTLNAFVDSEGDGQYAEVDEEGRYRVTLPFDRIDRDGGKASHYLRMSQPFSGENQGMHFPLRKGAEVLLTFIGGDPDRPVIAGSIPNASQPSVVNADNHTNSMIKTGAGNKIELEDKEGKNRIKFQTGDDTTYMHLGAPNHDGNGWVIETTGIERKWIEGGLQSTIYSNSAGVTEAGATTGSDGQALAKKDPTTIFPFIKRNNDGSSADGTTTLTNAQEYSGDYIIDRRIGNRYYYSGDPLTEGTITTTKSIEFNYGEGNIFNFGSSQEVTHWSKNDVNDAKGLVDAIYSKNVTGFSNIAGNNGTTWSDIVAEGEVDLKKTDSFIIQEGNIYDFGGYWNYNFGNSYEENHMKGHDINTRDHNFFTHFVSSLFGVNDRALPPGPDWDDFSGDLVSLKNGETWVSKSWGSSYDYFAGDSLEITEGDSESHTYGKSYDSFWGTAEEHFRGASHSTYWGASNDMFFGVSNSLMLGGYIDTTIAAAFETFIGAKSDITLAALNEIKLGMWTDISAGSQFTVGGGTEVRASLVAKAEVEAAAVKATATKLENALNAIHGDINSIHNGMVKIESKVTVLESAIVTMLS